MEAMEATRLDIRRRCLLCGWQFTVHIAHDTVHSDCYNRAAWFCPHCGSDVKPPNDPDCLSTPAGTVTLTEEKAIVEMVYGVGFDPCLRCGRPAGDCPCGEIAVG
jgi:hypothetical protein